MMLKGPVLDHCSIRRRCKCCGGSTLSVTWRIVFAFVCGCVCVYGWVWVWVWFAPFVW